MTKTMRINLGLAAGTGVAYFVFLLPFYTSGWYVPDFFLYHSFGQQAIIAHDGFSSLFVLIAALPLKYAKMLHIFCLGAMSVSLGTLLYFSSQILHENFNRLLAGLAVLSCGIWYYFYGKQFYDLPFSMLSLSLTLWLILCLEKHPWATKVLWISLGFFLSWKPYNIFTAAGLALLLLLHPQYGRIIYGLSISSLRDFSLLFAKGKKRLILQWAALATLGYFAGNFSIFIHPLETIKGILAYRAHYSFMKHLFSNMMIWDHVNSACVHLAAFYVPAACIILFLLPLLLNNKLFLTISSTFTLIYFFFITMKSPGYLWHSFMFAEFLVFFFIFALRQAEILPVKHTFLLRIWAAAAVVMQCLNNFVVYLPKEIFWFRQTEQAIRTARENSQMIYEHVEKSVQDLDGGFIIYSGLQRYSTEGNRKTAPLEKNWQALQANSGPPKYWIVICFPALHTAGMREIRAPLLNSSHLPGQDYPLRQAKDYGTYRIMIFEIKN